MSGINEQRVLTGLFLVCVGISVFAADWPKWRGPNGDAISAEKDWDPLAVNDQNKLLWKAEVETGFSTIVVAEGKAVTMGNTKDTDIIACFDAQTGAVLWKKEYAEPLDANRHEGGPHATPTIVEGKVYTISKTGKVFCLDLADGKVVWQKELNKKAPEWGFASSAVIVGDKVIYNVSDRGVALNKTTGQEIWAGENKPSGYSTAVVETQGNQTVAYLFDGDNLRCVNADTGNILWLYPWKTEWGVNASDPIVIGQEIFITSGYNHGCSLLKVEGGQPVKVWENKNMRSQLSGPVVLDGYIYGIDDNQLVCLDWKTGERKWVEKSVGKGSLMAADGKLIVLGEKGKLMIAGATPEKFEMISSAQILDGKCWTMPVLANGKVYARNAKGTLVCVDVAQKKTNQSAVRENKPAAQPSWPQWQGPKRNNISEETGLLKSWPEGGPKMLWQVGGLGGGFSTVSVADRKIYTTGMVNKEGVLFCIDWDGKELWKQSYGPEWTKDRPGVRCTPTIDNGKVYVVSGNGAVFCLNAADGKILWQENAAEAFEGKTPRWGYAESPLIMKDKMIVTVGGAKATMVALDKNTGKLFWAGETLGDMSAYCSPIAFEYGGHTIIAFYTSGHIMGVNAVDGKTLWTYDLKAISGGKKVWDIHPNTPIYRDGMLFCNSGYDMGAVMLKLNADGTGVSQEWTNKEFDTHHGSVVLVGDCLYGSTSKGGGDGDWMCVEWKTGKAMYQTHWECKGSLTSAEGMLYCYEEKNGTVALVKPDPSEFKPVSTFKVSLGSGEHWAHPVICGKRLFIRHGDVLMAYDIAAK
jgi:outer membrane protein assembly factor BamB